MLGFSALSARSICGQLNVFVPPPQPTADGEEDHPTYGSKANKYPDWTGDEVDLFRQQQEDVALLLLLDSF